MKKIIFTVLVLMLFLVGCGNEPQEAAILDTPENTSETVVNQDEITDDVSVLEEFTLTFRDVQLTMHGKMLPLLEVLGEPDFYFEAESCAFQGLDKTYTYGGIEIHTYESHGEDYISSILFLDDTLETDEGVVLFGSLDDILQAYGESFIEGFSLYTFEGMQSKINFLVENDEITSIEYVALNIEEKQK